MDTRENRIISTTACPVCPARIGKACSYLPGNRPYVHPERRLAWQDSRPPIRHYAITVHIDSDQAGDSSIIAGQIANSIRDTLRRAGIRCAASGRES